MKRVRPGSQQIWRKCNYRHEKEYTCDLEPEDAADALEGANKSGDSFRDAAARPACTASRLQCRMGSCCRGRGLIRPSRGLSLREGHHLTTGYAQDDSKDTANRVRTHSVMMLTAISARWLFAVEAASCTPSASDVLWSNRTPQPAHLFCAGRRSWRCL